MTPHNIHHTELTNRTAVAAQGTATDLARTTRPAGVTAHTDVMTTVETTVVTHIEDDTTTEDPVPTGEHNRSLIIIALTTVDIKPIVIQTEKEVVKRGAKKQRQTSAGRMNRPRRENWHFQHLTTRGPVLALDKTSRYAVWTHSPSTKGNRLLHL